MNNRSAYNARAKMRMRKESLQKQQQQQQQPPQCSVPITLKQYQQQQQQQQPQYQQQQQQQQQQFQQQQPQLQQQQFQQPQQRQQQQNMQQQRQMQQQHPQQQPQLVDPGLEREQSHHQRTIRGGRPVEQFSRERRAQSLPEPSRRENYNMPQRHSIPERRNQQQPQQPPQARREQQNVAMNISNNDPQASSHQRRSTPYRSRYGNRIQQGGARANNNNQRNIRRPSPSVRLNEEVETNELRQCPPSFIKPDPENQNGPPTRAQNLERNNQLQQPTLTLKPRANIRRLPPSNQHRRESIVTASSNGSGGSGSSNSNSNSLNSLPELGEEIINGLERALDHFSLHYPSLQTRELLFNRMNEALSEARKKHLKNNANGNEASTTVLPMKDAAAAPTARARKLTKISSRKQLMEPPSQQQSTKPLPEQQSSKPPQQQVTKTPAQQHTARPPIQQHLTRPPTPQHPTRPSAQQQQRINDNQQNLPPRAATPEQLILIENIKSLDKPTQRLKVNRFIPKAAGRRKRAFDDDSNKAVLSRDDLSYMSDKTKQQQPPQSGPINEEKNIDGSQLFHQEQRQYIDNLFTKVSKKTVVSPSA